MVQSRQHVFKSKLLLNIYEYCRGSQTLIINFPTSKVSKECKTHIKEALKEKKIVYWNTVFVDISSRLISVIAAYRDIQGKTPTLANEI